MIDSRTLGGGGAAVGDIMQTVREVTVAGNALVPLSFKPRALTPAEQSAMPSLTAQLGAGVVLEREYDFAVAGLGALSGNKMQTLAGAADGSVYYYVDNTEWLVRITPSGEGAFAVVVSTGFFDEIACSADGQVVVARAHLTTPDYRAKYYFSIDGGASFRNYEPAVDVAHYLEYKTKLISVSADGDTIRFVQAVNGNTNFSLVTINNARVALAGSGAYTPPTPVDLTAPMAAALASTPLNSCKMCISDSPDVITVLAHEGSVGNYAITPLKSEDGGASFTVVEGHPMRRYSTVNAYKWTNHSMSDAMRYDHDGRYPNIHVISNVTSTVTSPMSYAVSMDSGNTWQMLDRPIINGVEYAFAPWAAMRQAVLVNNGVLRVPCRALDDAARIVVVYYDLLTGGEPVMLRHESSYTSPTSFYATEQWNEAGDEAAVYLKLKDGSAVYTAGHLCMLRRTVKVLPSCPLPNSKIVGDVL